MASVQQLGEVSWSVVCAACCHMALVFAVKHFHNIIICTASVHLKNKLKKKSGINKSTEWSTIPVCPSLMCFFNMGNTKGTNSSKCLCLTFVYVLLHVNLCQN